MTPEALSATLPGVAGREATCLCGQLRLEVTGEPFAVSICHCLSCKRATGSAFAMQAAFKPEQVRIEGRYGEYSRISDEADRKEHILHFCPVCSSQVFYTEPTEPGFIAVSAGAFADPSFPPPTESGYDSRRHPWIGLPESMRLLAPELWWDHGQPLYEAGKYAEAADKGLELIEARRDQPYVYYNVACCESLANRTDDAIEHLRTAIEMWEDCRAMARLDPDFESIRNLRAFQELVGR
jgi:hypothetical protein